MTNTIKCHYCREEVNLDDIIVEQVPSAVVAERRICSFCDTEKRDYQINGEGCPIYVHHSGTYQSRIFFRAFSNDTKAWDIIDKHLHFQRDFKQACLELNALAKSQGWVERRKKC